MHSHTTFLLLIVAIFIPLSTDAQAQVIWTAEVGKTAWEDVYVTNDACVDSLAGQPDYFEGFLRSASYVETGKPVPLTAWDSLHVGTKIRFSHPCLSVSQANTQGVISSQLRKAQERVGKLVSKLRLLESKMENMVSISEANTIAEARVEAVLSSFRYWRGWLWLALSLAISLLSIGIWGVLARRNLKRRLAEKAAERGALVTENMSLRSSNNELQTRNNELKSQLTLHRQTQEVILSKELKAHGLRFTDPNRTSMAFVVEEKTKNGHTRRYLVPNKGTKVTRERFFELLRERGDLRQSFGIALLGESFELATA